MGEPVEPAEIHTSPKIWLNCNTLHITEHMTAWHQCQNNSDESAFVCADNIMFNWWLQHMLSMLYPRRLSYEICFLAENCDLISQNKPAIVIIKERSRRRGREGGCACVCGGCLSGPSVAKCPARALPSVSNCDTVWSSGSGGYF